MTIIHVYLLVTVLVSGGHATLHETKYHFMKNCEKQAKVVASDKHSVYTQCIKVK